jgi:hypothetical protein
MGLRSPSPPVKMTHQSRRLLLRSAAKPSTIVTAITSAIAVQNVDFGQTSMR